MDKRIDICDLREALITRQRNIFTWMDTCPLWFHAWHARLPRVLGVRDVKPMDTV